jgi:DNA-binding NarL/FixJ family response regulator
VKRSLARTKTRIFLVDDHPIVRRGLQLLLSFEPGLMVCGEADNGPAALQSMVALRPDMAVVDLALKSSSGLELIKQLHAQLPALKILVFTMLGDAIHAERALRAGADSYITKEEGTEKAVEAIRLLREGKSYVSPCLADSLLARLRGAPSARRAIDPLTDRELEILESVAQGLGSREIAQNLHVSIKTIESHREHIKRKLGLKRASELINYAYTWARDR